MGLSVVKEQAYSQEGRWLRQTNVKRAEAENKKLESRLRSGFTDRQTC